MRGTLSCALAGAMLTTACGPEPADIFQTRHEVYGVEAPDMLKMRAGPGTGFNIITGLPNGTVLWVHECTQTGGTRWCEVSMDRAQGLRGYVSNAYLRQL